MKDLNQLNKYRLKDEERRLYHANGDLQRPGKLHKIIEVE